LKPGGIIFGAVILVIVTVGAIIYALSGHALSLMPSALASSSAPITAAEDQVSPVKRTVKQHPDIKIGVYYFPGWRDHTPGTASENPWDPIQKFPERQPKLGWYSDGDDDVMDAQVASMAEHGLSYVSFDWYWGADNRVYLSHAINAFMKLKNKRGLQFSLLWANHDEAPVSLVNFDRMIDYWVNRYFNFPGYLKVDGWPVVTVFSAYGLEIHARKIGVTVAQLLERANKRAREEGLPGIYFVAGAPSDDPVFKTYSVKGSGYSAVSTYNLHQQPGVPHASYSYSELDVAYRAHWARYKNIGQLPVIVPFSSGWDRRPWGGSDDPAHDHSVGTPDEFEKHLRAGVKEIMDGGPPYLGVICCWNEYGEGSYIEPTKQMGDSVLQRVGKVLKDVNAP